jgi:hypothetical protein
MSAKGAAALVHMSHVIMEKVKKLGLILPLVLVAMEAQALTPVKVLKTNIQGPQPADSEIAKTVRAHINTEKYREVRVQLIRDGKGKPSHYLVYLLSKTSHHVDFAKITVDQHFKVLSVQQNYKLQDIDLKQQPGGVLKNTTSPGESH